MLRVRAAGAADLLGGIFPGSFAAGFGAAWTLGAAVGVARALGLAAIFAVTATLAFGEGSDLVRGFGAGLRTFAATFAGVAVFAAAFFAGATPFFVGADALAALLARANGLEGADLRGAILLAMDLELSEGTTPLYGAALTARQPQPCARGRAGWQPIPCSRLSNGGVFGWRWNGFVTKGSSS